MYCICRQNISLADEMFTNSHWNIVDNVIECGLPCLSLDQLSPNHALSSFLNYWTAVLKNVINWQKVMI